MVKVKSLVGTQGCADVDALVAAEMGFVPIRDSVEYHEASRVAPWDEPTEDNRTFGWQGFLQDPIEDK